jgi:CRP/FNR family nitrogen fixation transcriptional regulator
LEGVVRISRTLKNGHRQVLEFILPGELFGLENSGAYTATADAIDEVVVLRSSKSCIARQLRESGQARRQFAEMLSNGISSAQDHVATLAHQGALERVALFLLRFAVKQGDHVFSELPVGRQDMADYLGLTVETTCRTLGQMRDRRAIAIGGRRQIEIRNRAALVSYANGEAQKAVGSHRKPHANIRAAGDAALTPPV